MERCEKVSDPVGACSWLHCDWSVYILGRGLAKGELTGQMLFAIAVISSEWQVVLFSCQ